MPMTELDRATKAAWEELLRQLPGAIDFSEDKGDPQGTLVMPFDAFDLRAVVQAALDVGQSPKTEN